MHYNNLIGGTLIKRYKRFLADVIIDGVEVIVIRARVSPEKIEYAGLVDRA